MKILKHVSAQTLLAATLWMVGSSGSGMAQSFSVGVRGGIPFTDFLEAAGNRDLYYVTNTKRYTVGPTVEIGLPLNFRVSADALYKRVGFDFSDVRVGQNLASSRTRGNSWEFPIMLKLDMASGPIRPFLGAGVAFRHISGITQVQQIVSGVTFQQVEVENPAEFNKETDTGFVFGGGIVLKAGRVRIGPELRYTRWGGENLRDPIRALLRTNRNQGEVLVGITF